jgi:RepB DNA-primase N-terminal domain
MTDTNSFLSRPLFAPQYVLALHRLKDRVAVLVRNRGREQAMQRILLTEDIASPPFQEWLADQNQAGADIFIGMNPLRENSFARTKQSVREIRHVYLDLDEDAAASLRAIRTDGNTPVPNFVLDTSPEKNQVIWRVDGLDREQAESLLRSLARNSAATLRPPIFHEFCECLVSPTGNTMNNSLSARSRRRTQSITFAISRFTKTRPKRLAVLRILTSHRAECPWRSSRGDHPAHR